MADDRYSWLDKNAAENLLRGERVDAGGGSGADELNDLLNAAAVARALPSPDAPLPGEEAAVAAFRQVPSGRSTRDTAAGGAARAAAEDGIPVVRSVPGGGASRTAERTRLGRPFRRGFAVALAGCALGGVAVAAGTGVLPTPFSGGHADPSPSATAAVTPSLLESPGPEADASDDAARSPDARPDSSAPATPTAPGSSDGTPTPGHEGGGGTSKDPLPQLTPGGDGLSADKAKRRAAVLALCRDYEAGRTSPAERRRLERTMGGAEKLHTFCKQYLQQNGVTGGLGGSGPTAGTSGTSSGLTGGSGSSGGDTSGDGSGGDKDTDGHASDDGGQGGSDDDESHADSVSSTSPAPVETPTTAPVDTAPTPSATPSPTG